MEKKLLFFSKNSTKTKLLNENVNIIGRIIRGEVIYECIQTIVSNKEIVVYYDLKNFDLNTTTTTLFAIL